MNDLVIAGVELIAQIVMMIKDAQNAKTEQHTAILLRLQAAQVALATAEETARKLLEEQTALDNALGKPAP